MIFQNTRFAGFNPCHGIENGDEMNRENEYIHLPLLSHSLDILKNVTPLYTNSEEP